jgi:thiol-disulfide isomerase/thioredoxin
MLREERRKIVLASRRSDNQPAPVLKVLDRAGIARELRLTEGGKTTILIFFATWCPHCQNLFPQFKQVTETVTRDPMLAAKIRVIGIRTYIGSEKEPWGVFNRRFKPNFEIWTDSAQDASIISYSARYGFPRSIPRILVFDSKGVLRYVIGTGEYSDLAGEMLWTAEAVAGAS